MLNVTQGYYEFNIHPEHSEKTTFSTDQGHFKFHRVPFGFKGAPATFQRLMHTILVGLNELKAFVYLSNIIIYARSITYHLEKLLALFDQYYHNNKTCYIL